MGVIRKQANEEPIVSASDDRDDDNFDSLVILEFLGDVPTATIEWVLAKIQTSTVDGGAGLLARTTLNENQQECVIHVSASIDRLLLAAELAELKKPYKDGTLREISLTDLHHFRGADDPNQFLSMAEKQRLVKRALENIRANPSDSHVPGYADIKLYEEEAILPKLLELKILNKMFPLHNRAALKKLGKHWYQLSNLFKPQPIDMIHEYFGETVAMYFGFLGFYTMALLPPALIGIFTLIFSLTDDVTLRVFFAVFNLIWATLFLEAWKRNSATMAYTWGTLNSDKFEEPRSSYYGKLDVNSVTGRLEPKYPKWKRMVKFYCVSVPVIVMCLFLAVVIMLVYFYFQNMADVYYRYRQNTLTRYLAIVPSIGYAVVIVIMSILYRKMARFLTDWENHRLQSAYENHLITKLVVFDFFNCFMCLFYVAFYLQDMHILKQQVASLLITTQLINQVMESLLPYILYKRRKAQIKKQCSQHQHIDTDTQSLLGGSSVESSVREYGQIEAARDSYDSTVEDYLEMYLQFGYVFMFSSVFPTAAFWALLNNITEIRSDAFKMCRIFQRPFSQPVSGIGAWQTAFEVMNVFAVISNCALILLSPSIQQYNTIYGEIQVLLVFVFAEHIILLVKGTLSYMIPDEPDWVQTATARVEFQSRQAWIAQRLEDSKKQPKHKMSPAPWPEEITSTCSSENVDVL